MSTKRKLLLAMTGGIVLLVITISLYLTFSDFSGWRNTVARMASEAMGRELAIAGEFEVDFGGVTRVRATEVSLANAEWGSDSSMAVVDRLVAEIDLRSLITGSIHLPLVEIQGGRALFESSADNESNWALGDGDKSGHGSPVRLRIDRIRGTGLDLVFRSSAGGQPFGVTVSSLDSTGDAQGMHRLSLEGALRDTELELSGRLGPLDGLINLTSIDHDLDIRLGGAEIRSAGIIGDLAAMAGLNLEASATVPDPDEITRLLMLPESRARSLEIEMSVAPSSGRSTFNVSVAGPAMELHAHGSVDSLIAPGDLDLDLVLAGPDIRPIAALRGVDDIPERPFDVKGHLRWQGFPVEVDGLRIVVGDNRLSADGVLGAPPLMLDTEFRFHGSGPNVAAVAALGGLRLPAEPFSFDGRVVRVENGVEVQDVKATVGHVDLTMGGFVGDAPDYAGTELRFDARGPDLVHLRLMTGLDLPKGAFRIEGLLNEGDQAIALHGVSATVGRSRLTVEGRLTTGAGMAGTDLLFTADGPDASKLWDVGGLTGFPALPYHVEGGLTRVAGGNRLRNLSGHLGDLQFLVDGLLRNDPRMAGSRLRIEAEGSDLSTYSSVAGLETLPREHFRAESDMEFLADGLRLHQTDLELGPAMARVSGMIGRPPAWNGTDLTIEAHGPSLAIAEQLVPQLTLPHVEFSSTGRIAFSGGKFALYGVTADIAGNRLAVEGTVDPQDRLDGSELEITLEGNDFNSAGQLIAKAMELKCPELPAREYTISGKLALSGTGYQLESLSGTMGGARARIEGRLEPWPSLTGTDLEIHVDGPDASLFRAVAGTEIPAAPFQLDGRLTALESGFGFDQLRLRYGDFRAEVDGTIGKLPKLIGSDLRVRAEGPDLNLAGDLVGFDGLPAESFSVAGLLKGDPGQFMVSDLQARLGSSDAEGSVRVEFAETPMLELELRSRTIHLPELWPADTADHAPGNKAPDTPPEPDQLMIPDTPIDLAALSLINGDLNWEIGELALRRYSYTDLGVAAQLRDGRLTLDRFWGTGNMRGGLRGSGRLEPLPHGFQVTTQLTHDDGMINLAGENADPSQYTPIDVQIQLTAAGASAHELAANSNGRISVVLSEGEVDSSIIDLVSIDILVSLLKTLNPFNKDDSGTELNCAVLVGTFDSGVMTLEPAAIQTEKVTILGQGTIDFQTESVNFEWVSKPRKGIGLKASTLINSYIRLGGTLSDPILEMKPLEALTTTGLAVATFGLSLVGKGLLHRITAERKVCEHAMKEADLLPIPED